MKQGDEDEAVMEMQGAIYAKEEMMHVRFDEYAQMQGYVCFI